MKPKTLRALYLAIALLAGLASIPAYGQAKPWLDVLIGRRLTHSGTAVPQRSNLELGSGFTVTDDPANDRSVVTASGVDGGAGTGSLIVSTQAALKNLHALDLTDGQQVTVKATNKVWVWAATAGAGFVGDDLTSAQLSETLTANAGRFYPSDGAPVVDTIAALRAATGSIQPLVQVRAFSSLGDGGGGQFARRIGTTTDNGGTRVQPIGTAFYFDRVFSGAIQGEWFGMRADGIRITDGVTTALSTAFSCALCSFTSADVGKKILLRTASHLASGTCSVPNNGQTVTCSGENFPVDLPIAGGGSGVGQPESGGAFYIDGQYLVAQYTDPPNHQIVLPIAASPAISSKPFYVETQLATTIATFVNATHVTLTDAATISQTAVPGIYATDDTTATDNAITAAATSTHWVKLPAGLIGHSSNLNYVGVNRLSIEGAGGAATTFVDLRRASFQFPYPMAASNYGSCMNFDASSDIHLSGFGYDGSVPVFGMIHSDGGTVNAGGGRAGFRLQNTPNSSVIGMGSQGFAARDEYIAFQGSANVLVEGCNIPRTNNAAVNVNGGGTGLRITHNNIGGGILVAGDSYVIDGNIVTGFVGVGSGITVDTQGHGIVANNTIHDGVSYASGAIDVFGTNDAAASLTVANNTIFNMTGQYYTGAGAIAIKNFGGHVNVTGNTIKNNSSFAAGGRDLYVSGAATGTVIIGPNVFGPSTAAMLTGVYVNADVPAGAVQVLAGSKFDSAITTRLSLNSALGQTSEIVTVSATGTTTLSSSTRTALVTANGTVNVTLADPTKIPDAEVVIKNDTTQAGTTTVGTAAGNIDGAATLSLPGANLSAVLKAVGGNWKLLAGSSVVGGGVPSARTVTAGAGLTGGGDLSANRSFDVAAADGTIVVNADSIQVGTVPVAQVSGAALSTRTITGTAPITVDGDNASHDLSANRTIAISGATGSVNGSIRLTTDLGGSSTAPVVVNLSGAAGTLGITATTAQVASGSAFTLKGADLTTNSGTAPAMTIQAANETGTTSVGGKLFLGSGSGTTAQGAVGIKLGATEVWTLSRVNSTTTQLALASDSLSWTIPTGRYWQLISPQVYQDADSVNFRTTAGTDKGTWNINGLNVGDGTALGSGHAFRVTGGDIVLNGAFTENGATLINGATQLNGAVTLDSATLTFAAAVSNPGFSQATATSGNGTSMTDHAQSGFGTGDTYGGDRVLVGGDGHGAGLGGGFQAKTGSDSSGTLASLAVHKVGAGYAGISMFGIAADSDLNHRSNVLWMGNIDNIGTGARPGTGAQWFVSGGMPSCFGSNANSKEINFTGTTSATANGGTAVAATLGGVGAVFMDITVGGNPGKVLLYAP